MMTHLLANVYKKISNPVKGRPKRSGDKNMGGLLTIQGPKSSG